MLVAGGTYREICRFPSIDELYGSGLRGVCAIADITDNRNRFFTYSAENVAALEAYADTYEFELDVAPTGETIEFDYLHNHAEPILKPGAPERPEEPIGPVEDEAILRFGMVEGTAIVEGDRVVYDPQSPDFESFHENGSEADKLAVVLNETEGRNLTGQTNPEEIVEHLCGGGREYDVAVVKRGPYGALVGEDDEIHTIPVYRTPSVRNIGSGDIFSSVFAAYWAERKESAVEAARSASLATAFYSYEGILPIPESPEEALDIDLQEVWPEIESDPPSVYLAGPFFTIGQFFLIEEFYNALRDLGIDVFSPFHDVGMATSSTSSREIAKRDLKGLDDSDVMLALLDGEDPGTYFEIGHARDNELPVVAYQHNPDLSHHTMLEGTDCQIHGDVTSAIFNAIWTYYD